MQPMCHTATMRLSRVWNSKMLPRYAGPLRLTMHTKCYDFYVQPEHNLYLISHLAVHMCRKIFLHAIFEHETGPCV